MRGQKLSVSLTNPATSSPTGFVNADENGNIKTGKEAGKLQLRSGRIERIQSRLLNVVHNTVTHSEMITCRFHD